MTKFIEIVTTFESVDEAREISNEILNLKLGACCSIVPIESLYRWKNKIVTTQEFQLTIKTVETNYVDLENLILRTHSYENPQIISIPMLGGSRDYLSWLEKETEL
jgi:periplasmic divalent cation tolerance protein